MEPVDAGELLKNLIVSWKSRLERAKISDQLQIESDLPPVEGDLRALEQIFTNLINNAFEAMTLNPANREKILGIKVRRMPTTNGLMQLQFSISDTGVGIPDEIRERIFEPFFTTKTGGTGIGLAIVKRIITAHKGSISVDSIPGGTVFHVQLPTYREKTQPLPEIA
jgi:signal transduction histidine kinase